MILATLPIAFAVVGLLVYALASNGKVAEAGRIAYACGLLVALLALEHSGAVRILAP
jgi:hypothetical protein